VKITAVRAIALSAPFEKAIGGLDKVPPHVLRPAANQVTVPRLGQASTIVCVETDDGLKGYGEALGLPVHRLLGGALRDRIEVYASPVPLMPTRERSAQEAAAFVEQGSRGLKLKIGRGVETDEGSPAAGGALSASRRPRRRRLRSVAAW
jgi:L-alanine-DL-glutamate epimerase-like enolase superfamily enzyme